MFLSQVVGDGEAWLTELGWVHSWCKTQLVLINFILLRNRTSLALHSLRASVWKWGTSYTYFNNFFTLFAILNHLFPSYTIRCTFPVLMIH